MVEAERATLALGLLRIGDFNHDIGGHALGRRKGPQRRRRMAGTRLRDGAGGVALRLESGTFQAPIPLKLPSGAHVVIDYVSPA